MRTLEPAPSSFLDARGEPRFGSFSGGLPPVDVAPLAKRRLDLVTQRKRWVYAAVATPDHFVGVAGAHLGYAVTIFAFVYDRAQGRMLADRGALGPPLFQRFGDALPATSAVAGGAILKVPGASFAYVTDPDDARRSSLDFQVGDISARFELDASAAPPAIGVIAKVPGGVVNTTEKRPLLDVKSGRLSVGSREIPLGGALAGYDYTHGLLARRTAWRWAFLMGKAKTGERVAMNLVQGFVGEPECAVWIDGEVFGVGVGVFGFDERRPLDPWTVKTACGAVDLTFKPGGMHAEKKNFGVIASKFVQPVGCYSGAIDVGSKRLELEDVLGVTEDQDVLW